MWLFVLIVSVLGVIFVVEKTQKRLKQLDLQERVDKMNFMEQQAQFVKKHEHKVKPHGVNKKTVDKFKKDV